MPYKFCLCGLKYFLNLLMLFLYLGTSFSPRAAITEKNYKTAMPVKKFQIIAYDIVKTRKRNKVAEILKDYGIRIQKSVFECRLNDVDLNRLTQKLSEAIDKKTDSILIYYLCEACVKQMHFLGVQPVSLEKDFLLL